MIRIELTELGSGADWPLTPEQGRRLAQSGVVAATPSPYLSGYWQISSVGRVGAARVGDVEIHITPKVPVARLLFLAGYASHGEAWREEDIAVGEAADLVPALAHALWRQVGRAILQGLLPGYVTVEDTSTVMRGRLRETEQLHRHHGLPLPLEVRHDEFTVDIAENRILRTACERMLTTPRVETNAQRMLRRLLREFIDVTPLARWEQVPHWQPTRLNARYHSALRLAEIVLRATSIEHGAGGVIVNGFLFDMPKLFEEFVITALRDAVEDEYGGRIVGQDQSYFLDHAGRIKLRPDIVWYLHGRPAAVADAKYKAEQPTGYPNADLYQMLAYCTALKLPRGHLIYARGAGGPVRHVVRESCIEILGHALDLEAEQDRLLKQVGGLATLIAHDAMAAVGVVAHRLELRGGA